MKIGRVAVYILLSLCLTLCFAGESASMGDKPSNTQRGVLVSITNKGESPVYSIKILYTGGLHTIPVLEAGETVQNYINPTSESHLEIEFLDKHKQNKKAIIDTYFERDYSGTLSIFIDDNGKVTWEDNIRVQRRT